uniref:Peptidase M16 middle/third domain-containing protein n=1 Tax=Romanomermis culicivorax TaxID=13658 RepID=A0A915IEA8_ROMCU
MVFGNSADEYRLCTFVCALTNHGLANVEEILKRLFAYLGQIKKRLSETWLHEEIKVKYGNAFHLAFLQELHQLLNNTTIDESLVYPSPNPYIPKKLRLSPKTGFTYQPVPKLLSDDGLQNRLWHVRDVIFRRPHISARFLFRCPINPDSLRFYEIASILNSMVTEQMDEKLYQMKAAGYDYAIDIKHRTLTLTFQGYSSRMHLIIDSFFKEFFSLKYEEKILEVFKQNRLESVENSKLSDPSQLANAKLMEFSRATFWTANDQKEIVKGTSVK